MGKEASMYIVSTFKVVDEKSETLFFGPFQTEERAREYIKSMPSEWGAPQIDPLIVPNCVGVTFQTKY